MCQRVSQAVSDCQFASTMQRGEPGVHVARVSAHRLSAVSWGLAAGRPYMGIIIYTGRINQGSILNVDR
jgi:hypothetical protein